MKRRNFLNWVGVGFFATSLPVVLAACQTDTGTDTAGGGDAPEPVDTTPREDGFAAIGRVSELDETGSVSSKTLSVAVIRDPANAEALIAVNSLCTHQGCAVEWEAGEGAFACPCHGSAFAPDGSVTSGPAEDPLGMFEAKIEDDLVLVKT
ncbi:MAG: ubiquinol-cytochrome c reductase iron-sulfur subunit [Geitlerinemataceae cyanobacterium]